MMPFEVTSAAVGDTGFVLEVSSVGTYRLDYPERLATATAESWSELPDELFSYELVNYPWFHIAVGYSESPVHVGVMPAGCENWTRLTPVQIDHVWACPRPAGEVTLRITNASRESLKHLPVRRYRDR